MIDVKRNPPSGSIVLDRPTTGNALDRQMVEEFRQALDDLRQEKKVRGVILAASGYHFCSGVDLKQLNSTAKEPDALQQWQADAQALHELLEQMLYFPKPIIAAVDGAAFGIGLALALAADLIVASDRASFALPATRYGLVSGLTVPLLHFRAGGAVTSQLLLGRIELSANDAHAIGLVRRVVVSDQVWVASHHWIEQIAEGSAESLQLSKKVLNETVGERLATQLSIGAAAMASALTTDAGQEGLQAFEQKRPPEFPA